MRIFFLLLFLPSVVFGLPTVIVDGRLTWVPPETMIDGSPITGELSYVIYCGTPYVQITELVETEIPLLSLGLSGAQTCVVTAKVGLLESSYSNPVNFTCTTRCLSGDGPLAPVLKIN